MGSVSVPDFYRRSIMVELEIPQSREEARVQCRQQLCVSHTLGFVEDADDPEQQGIQSKNSSCKAFSIRGYVMNIREKDKYKCWPFHPHLLQRRMKALPPLEVPTFRYWECLECLDNEFNLDRSEKRRNYQQKPDYLTDTIIISGHASSPAKPSDDVNGYLEVARSIATDERSAKTRVETDNEICCNEDGIALHSPTRQLTSHKSLEGDNLNSVNNIVACNATVWPTDSEEMSDSKQSFCTMDKDKILTYHRSNQLTAETDMSSFTEDTDQLMDMPGTMNTLSKSDEKISQDNHENGTVHEAVEKFAHGIQEDKTLALPIVDNFDREMYITKEGNDGIITDVKKPSSKRQYSKGKTLKKRLISDLISVPLLEQPNTEINWNGELKQMSVSAKIDKWRVSKTASYSLKKFKSPDNPHLESVYVKRKRQRQGSSYQSSSAKSSTEAREVLKRHFGTAKFDSPQKKIVSNSWRNKVLVKELTQNEQDRQTSKDPGDDFLDDLARFMAKNQCERYATTPRSSSLEQTVRLKGSTAQNKDAEGSNCFVTEKLDKFSNSIQPHSSLSLKEDLVKGTVTSISSLTKPSSVGEQVCLLVEDCMNFNQVQGYYKNEKQEISGHDMEAEVISITMIGSASSSAQHVCKNAQMLNRKQINKASIESVSGKDNIGDVVIAEAMENYTSSTFQRKSATNSECFLRTSHDQLSIIEQNNSASQDATHSFLSSDIKRYNSGSYGTVPTSSGKDTFHSHKDGFNQSMSKSPCKGIEIDSALTVAATTFGLVQTIAAGASTTTQTAVQSSLAPNVLTDLDNSVSSNLRTACNNQTKSCSEPNRVYTTSSEGFNPLPGLPQPTIAVKTINSKQKLMSKGRDLSFENSGASFQHVKDQVRQKQRTCVAEPISTFPVLGTTGQQPPEILSCASLTNPYMEDILPNNRTFQHSFDTLETSSSLGAEPPADAVPLRLPVIPSFAQGNKLDSQTTLLQECFDEGKCQLLSYIEKRIRSYCPSQTSKITVANKAEKGQHVEFQTAVSLEPNLCTLNKNPADFMSLESSPPKEMRFGHRQTTAVIGLSAGKHSIKNMEDTQVQPDCNMAPHIIPSFSQAIAVGRSEESTLEILDEQHCRMETHEEGRHGHSNSEIAVPESNMKISYTLENSDEEILGSMPDRGRQAQTEIQTSEPGPAGQSQTNVRRGRSNYDFNITLRSGKSLDSTYITKRISANNLVLKRRRYMRKAGNKAAKTKRKKHVKKAENKATKIKRKREGESRSIQIEICTTDNHTKPDNISVNRCSQYVPSSTQHVFGYNHVLNPITQNNQAHLPPPSDPFPANQLSKEAAEARMKLTELRKKMMGSEKKLKNQPSAIPPHGLQAIENYIKRGIFSLESLDPPSSKGLPTNLAESVKPGAGPLHHSTPGQNSKFLNPPKPSIHLNLNISGAESKMSGTVRSTSSFAIPSCEGNANVVIPLQRSNGNGENVIPSYAGKRGKIGNLEGTRYMRGLLKPLGPSEQQALLPQIQAYLDKSHNSKVSVSKFSSPEDKLMTESQSPGSCGY